MGPDGGGNHGAQVALELPWVVQSSQAVGQLVEKAAQKSDDGERLFPDQLPVRPTVGRLQRSDGFFTDRDEPVHQPLEYRAELGIARRHQQKLEARPGTRPVKSATSSCTTRSVAPRNKADRVW